MNSFEYNSNTDMNPNAVKIITRLRGPVMKKVPVTKQSPSPIQDKKKPLYQRANSNRKKTPERTKSPLPNPQGTKCQGVNENTKYTMFTSRQPANTVLVSSKPIEGKNINDTFKNTTDLYDFSKTILKETSLLEFDRVYNESTKLDIVYNENIKGSISNLFHGKNSCVLFFGPMDGGKSFLLRGSADDKSNEPGILSRAVVDLFNLVELTRQANQNSKLNNYFVVKCSAYQVYLDNVNDLLARETRQIKLEKYFDENSINCNMIGLTQKEIRNKQEYDLCIKEAVNQRKWLTQVFKVNELKRKSHFVISLRIEKRERTSDGITKTNECSIDNYAQIDFVELASSNYGFMNDIDESDESLNGILYRNTSKVFNALCNNIVSASAHLTPKLETKLTLCLKKTLRSDSSIVFINCVVPWEYPLNQSFKSLKFANWLRNQVLNLNENNDYQINYPYEEEGIVNQNNNQTISSNRNLYNKNSYQEDMIQQQPQYVNGSMTMSPYKNNNRSTQYRENTSKDNINSSVTMDRFIPNSTNNTIIRNNSPPSMIMNNNTIAGNINSSVPNMKPLTNKSASPIVDNYSSNDESDLKMFRERARMKYQSFDLANTKVNKLVMNKSSQDLLRPSIMQSKSGINMSNNYMDDNSNNMNQDKIKLLEESIRLLEEKNNEVNQKLENFYIERSRCMDDSRYANKGSNSVTVSYLPDQEVEKIKQDYATLKSDNIIFREDINRLTDINKHLEDELSQQRNRNLEIAAENERIVQEKLQIEKELKEAKEKIEKSKIQEQNLVDQFNQRVIIENKVRDTENELNKLREEKSKFEIEYRVNKERYEELKKNYDNLVNTFNITKQTHDDEVTKIEEKIDLMTREMEKLQKENTTMRATDERQRQEILSLEKQRDSYKEKYQEQKNKNNLLTTKLAEIEEDFKSIMKEKENEQNLKLKEEQLKKMKVDSKMKILSELQNRIGNYKNERLKKKNDEH